MKKIFFILCFVLLSLHSYSQIFNTGRILKPGVFSLGVYPALTDAGVHNDLRLNLVAGYGLSDRIDVSVRYQFMDFKDYFGADFEFAIRSGRKVDVSLVTGAHVRNDIGLDGTLCVSVPVSRQVTIFSGLDLDLELQDDIQHYTWLPLGLEVKWRRKMSLLLEVDIPMSHYAYNIFAGGVEFYF